LLYVPKPGHGFSEKGSQGASYFTAENPPFGAVFTYYLSNEYKSLKKIREEEEKKLLKENKSVLFPGWEQVEAEIRQPEPKIWVTVSDLKGTVIRNIEAENKKGFNRISWDLRYPSLNVIDIKKELPKKESGSYLVGPGTYSVTLSKEIDGKVTVLSGPKQFEVKQLYQGTLKGLGSEKRIAFNSQLRDLQKEVSAAVLKVKKLLKKMDALKLAALKINVDSKEIIRQIYNTKQKIYILDEKLSGKKSKNEVGEKDNPTILYRLNTAFYGSQRSLYGPTQTHIKSFEIAKKQFAEFDKKLKNMVNKDIPSIEKKLLMFGAPIVE